MGDHLVAGNMGHAADASTPAEFAGSMADYIEKAYWDALDDDGKKTFDRSTNTETDRDRRRIFVAIARGVLGYINDNQAAFTIASTGLPSGSSLDVSVQVEL